MAAFGTALRRLIPLVLAAIAVPELAEGIRSSPGRRVYVANLNAEGRETAGFDVADHVAALAAHLIRIGVKMINRHQIRVACRSTRKVFRSM